MMEQHSARDVMRWLGLAFRVREGEGKAYDVQYPRHAFVVTWKMMQPGIDTFRT